MGIKIQTKLHSLVTKKSIRFQLKLFKELLYCDNFPKFNFRSKDF